MALVTIAGFVDHYEQKDPQNETRWRTNDKDGGTKYPRMISGKKLFDYAKEHYISFINNSTTATYWASIFNRYTDDSLKFILHSMNTDTPREVHKIFSLNGLYNPLSLKNCKNSREQLWYLHRMVDTFRREGKFVLKNLEKTIKEVWRPVWRQLQLLNVI